MGLTIHYSGTFRSNASLGNLIEETVAFSKVNNWEYLVLETKFADSPEPDKESPIYGIVVFPPNCESICLAFNPNRKLGFYSDLREVGISTWVGDENGNGEWVEDKLPDDYQPTWGSSTKTQFAGADIHMKVVQLLRQISVDYLDDFEIFDESDYWNHGDADILRKRFGEGIDFTAPDIDFSNPDFRIPNL